MAMKHTTSKAMQASAKRGLQAIKDGHVQETDVPEISLKSGRKIASGQQISDDHVRSMAQYHSGHAMPFASGGGGCPVTPMGGHPDAESCDDMLWGGPAGASWSASRVAAMDATILSECDAPDMATLLDSGNGFSMEIFARGDLLDRVDLTKDEDGIIWAPIIRSGTLAMRPNPKVPGGKEAKPLVFVAGHASDHTKEIGLADLVDAFEAKAVEHVTIPKTHANDTLENTGQIVAMKIADSTVRPGEKVILAGHKFTEPDVEGKVMRGTVISRSCGILHDYVNQETGASFPHVVEHVALTNKPWVTGMEPYGSETFSRDREVVPMLLSEDAILTPPAPTERRKPLFSTSQPLDALAGELNLADIQWGDEPSLMDIRSQLYNKLREMGSSPDYEEPSVYFDVMDVTPTKALVQCDYGDRDADMDAWVIPFSVDDQGVLHLADFADWQVVEQKWVTDDDAQQDKQEVQQILQEATNMTDPTAYLEAHLHLSEDDLNLATLTGAARKKLPSDAFVFPPKDGKPGAYPIHDAAHARNALARVAQHGTDAEKKAVKAAVKKRYPNIDVDGDDGGGSNDMSVPTLPEDPLARASTLRLSVEPPPNQQGATMGLTPELLAQLNLDANSRELLQREIAADQAKDAELERYRKLEREGSVKERITKMSEMGFADCPGLLAEVERILLADDGHAAIRLDLSAEGKGVTTLTATEIVDRIVNALPSKDGKLDLAGKANLLDNPMERRPDLKPEGQNEGDKPMDGDALLEQWKRDGGPQIALALDAQSTPDGFGPVQGSTLLVGASGKDA